MILCSKCGTRPVRAEKQRYCGECHASYQKDYRALAAKKRERTAYFRGFEACRLAAVEKFERSMFAEINGWQAAQAVRDLRVP